MGRSLTDVKRAKFPIGGTVAPPNSPMQGPLPDFDVAKIQRTPHETFRAQRGSTPPGTPPGTPTNMSTGNFGKHINYTSTTDPYKLRDEAVKITKRLANPKATHTVLHVPHHKKTSFENVVKNQLQTPPTKQSMAVRIPSRLGVQATHVRQDSTSHDKEPYQFGGMQANSSQLMHYTVGDYKARGKPIREDIPQERKRERSRDESRSPSRDRKPRNRR